MRAWSGRILRGTAGSKVAASIIERALHGMGLVNRHLPELLQLSDQLLAQGLHLPQDRLALVIRGVIKRVDQLAPLLLKLGDQRARIRG